MLLTDTCEPWLGKWRKNIVQLYKALHIWMFQANVRWHQRSYITLSKRSLRFKNLQCSLYLWYFIYFLYMFTTFRTGNLLL